MRVIVTRPADRSADLVAGLRALGHDVVLCPLIRIESLGDEPIDASGYDWLVVTSAGGARELGRRLTGKPARIAAIGAATAAALAEAGLPADLVPASPGQEALLDELPRPAGRVLVAAAERGRRLLVEELRADLIVLYRTVELRPAEPPDGDLVVLASGSAARAFAALGVDVPAVSIGPQTSQAARGAGLRVVAEAETAGTAGLLAAVATLES